MKQYWDAENGIRNLVWRGPDAQAKDGFLLRGLVGRTDNGFKAGGRILDQNPGARGSAHNGGVMFSWSNETYAHKEQAIVAAHKWVADNFETDHRQADRSISRSPQKSPAQKYGGASDALQRELPPPRRSR